jgi:hypothetical protein
MLNYAAPIIATILIYFIVNNSFVKDKFKIQNKHQNFFTYLLYIFMFILFFYKTIFRLEPISIMCSLFVITYLLYKAFKAYNNSNFKS